jgi:hypothetical protein
VPQVISFFGIYFVPCFGQTTNLLISKAHIHIEPKKNADMNVLVFGCFFVCVSSHCFRRCDLQSTIAPKRQRRLHVVKPLTLRESCI